MKEVPPPRSSRMRNRALIAGLTLLTTAGGAWIFARGLAADDVGLLAIPLFGIFVVLFLWISLSFWLATVGFVRRLRGQSTSCAAPAPEGAASPQCARCHHHARLQ